ncbi:YkoP family protein [Bacillus sp. 0909A]|uniref:YkoP family protein n=1 Tax=Bacillus sp. 0909A TaxID=3120561 RepID=UPI002FD947B7
MKTCFLSIWRVIDPIYFFFSRLTLIDDEQKCVFRVRLTKYKGHHVVLSDGTHIRKNDVLVKIHLHNIKLVRELRSIESAVRKGIIIYQKVYQSMPMLLEYINNHKKSEKIKGIIGITMLDKGVERLGFDVVTPVNPFYRSFKKITHMPILYLTAKPVSLRNLPDSSYLFISKEKLQHTYQTKD